MTDRMRVAVVVGAGGLLGSVLVRLSPPGQTVTPVRGVDWSNDGASDHVLRTIADAVPPNVPFALYWCAGAGVIGSNPDVLDRETRVLERVLHGLAADARPVVFLASSAGGVYGASSSTPLDEVSPTGPLSDYGHNKLRQEAILRDWATDRGARAIVARISTLYGPGQSMSKNQGLISHLCRSVVTRQPVSIFVPLDTVRDYLYVDDMASMASAVTHRVATEPPGTVATKIFASSRSISIGGVLSEVRRVCPKAPPVVLGSSPNRSAYGATLSYRSCIWPEYDRRPITPLPVGIAATYRSIARRFALSGEA